MLNRDSMNLVSDIINKTGHRPWQFPADEWAYYQEWNNAIFLHFPLQADLLRAYIPRRLRLDTFEGVAWISIVAFTMNNIRPRWLPSVPLLSTFHEVNVRTYVEHKGFSGVYFLNIQGTKKISCFVARHLSGLPYVFSSMKRNISGNDHEFCCGNSGEYLNVSYSLGDIQDFRSPMDSWLTERYCLYLDRGRTLYRYQIHHEPWQLRAITISDNNLKLGYDFPGVTLENLNLAHYSDGVKVLAWKRQVVL